MILAVIFRLTLSPSTLILFLFSFENIDGWNLTNYYYCIAYYVAPSVLLSRSSAGNHWALLVSSVALGRRFLALVKFFIKTTFGLGLVIFFIKTTFGLGLVFFLAKTCSALPGLKIFLNFRLNIH